HHGEQIAGDLYGHDRQPGRTCTAAQRGEIKGFTKRYKITRLVYHEPFRYSNNCIAREKQVKAWTRAKRVALIESVNPTWEDLAADWFDASGELNRESRSLAALGMTNWMNG
ncbi:MAG: hypothetical protein ACRD3R_12260, partial [Terriglobales bacterium]